MSVPATSLSPPFAITRASHLVLTARDLKRSRDFYVEVLGLVVSDETADTLWLRGVEERGHHSLTLKRSAGGPVCERIGLRVFTEDDLDKAKAYFDRKGTPARFVEVPHQGRTLQVSDRAGVPLEFCATMTAKPRLHTRFHEHKGAAALRLDHFQVLVPDVIGASGFYAELGFRVSSYARLADGAVVGVFMYRKDNPHDMVLLTRSGPRYHHVGFVIQELHHAIRALDIAGNLGFADNLEHGPGRHGHGHSYYCYWRDPDGHRIELLLPAVQMVDIDEEVEEFSAGGTNTLNLWGPPAPRSWVEEATAFADVEVVRIPGDGERYTLEKYLAAKAPIFALPVPTQKRA